MKHASRIIILLALGFLFEAAPQAQAQSATPYYWYGADNTVWNLRIQIYQAQQQLAALYYRARFIRFTPQSYQEHMRQVNALHRRIYSLQSQLQSYQGLHWR
tara:strand:- start:154 stop:459 length:306 start_codon:yes stop_codon:yes gene_type:complete